MEAQPQKLVFLVSDLSDEENNTRMKKKSKSGPFT